MWMQCVFKYDSEYHYYCVGGCLVLRRRPSVSLSLGTRASVFEERGTMDGRMDGWMVGHTCTRVHRYAIVERVRA